MIKTSLQIKQKQIKQNLQAFINFILKNKIEIY